MEITKEKMWSKYNKRVKRPLPDYSLKRPPGQFTLDIPLESISLNTSLSLKSQRECCVIFALFMAYDGIIPHYVINSSFWAAHSWRVNTDMIDKGWDIWFLVDNKLWEDMSVRDAFEMANLTEFVLLFDVPEGRVIRHKLGAKLYATTVPYFENYYRCYLWDTDNFVSVRDVNNKLPVDILLDIGKDERLFMTHRYSYDPDRPQRNIAKQKYETDDEAEARLIYNPFVKKYLDYLPPGRTSVSGQVYAWNPQRLRPDFKDMVEELTPNISDDEEQYGLYLHKTGLTPELLADIWGIPIYFNREDFFRNDDYYFDHIWIDRFSDPLDGDRWQSKSSIQEVEPIGGYDNPEIKKIWRHNIGLHRRV